MAVVRMNARDAAKLQGGSEVPRRRGKATACHVGPGTGQIAVAHDAPHVVQSITLALPLPTAKCSPNAANALGHWSVSNKARTEYKDECLSVLPKFNVPLFEKATIDLTFYLAPCAGRYHPRDEANAIASAKGLQDALVACGLLKDDSARYLASGAVKLLTRKSEHGGLAGVVVTLRREP